MAIETEKYAEAFLSEAKENLQSLNASLLKLEKTPGDSKLVDELFRLVHSLKGMAATMGHNKMAELCHGMEDVLDEVKKKERELTPEISDVFFGCFDNLESSVRQISQGGEEAATDASLSRLRLIPSATPGEKRPAAEGVALAERPETMEKIESVKVKVETLDALMDLIEELLVNKLRLNQVYASKQFEEMGPALNMLGRLVADAQYNVMRARLVPVEQVFNKFPRMVRDLARKEGKDVNLVLEGGEIELDRTIIDKLGEPLVHLLRNAVDHGIERPEARIKRNKPGTGTIKLVARREQGYVIIEVEDDGKGLDTEQIREVAIKRKIMTGAEAAATTMSEDKITDLLCDPRFSTVEKVTDVSGRGVGLNVVKTVVVDALSGGLRMGYRPGKGMKVTLKLPLTLAIIRALLAAVGDEIYAIPMPSVVRSVMVKKGQIRQMVNQEVAVLPEANVPFVRLRELFNLPGKKEMEDAGALTVVIVRKNDGEFIGLGVDALVDEQEIILKPPGMLIKQNKTFAGSTILGDGRAILVLDVNNIAKGNPQSSQQ